MAKKQKGFTIIELIVVIAIIALLSGIVAINVTKYIAKSKQSRVKAEFANFQKALTAFYAKYGDYPGAQWGGGYFYPENHGGSAPYLEDGTGIHYLSDFYKIDWTNDNATYYGSVDYGFGASPAFYELDIWDSSTYVPYPPYWISDGKIGCAYINLCYDPWQMGWCDWSVASKNILCQDCPDECGSEYYEWQ